MGTRIIEGVIFYPVDPIVTTGGRVMHGIKGLDTDLPKFGECYFSTAVYADPKAWKKHHEMVCNLFVAHGKIQIVFYDDREGSPDFGQIREFILSDDHYGRLVINPGIWFGFVSLNKSSESVILNVATIAHRQDESLRLDPMDENIPYTWNFK